MAEFGGDIAGDFNSELEGDALPDIVQELRHVPYLSQIVIGLDRADENQFRSALKFFSVNCAQPMI